MSKTPAQRAAKHGAKAVPAANQPPANPGAPRDPAKAAGNANLIVIASLVASLFLFWYFHLLTLNQMTDLSGGLAMPDSLIGGFDTAYVHQLRAAMNEDALGQLDYVHKTAGTLFPLVFGFSALVLIAVNVAKKQLRWALWAAPLLFAVVQLCANVAVGSMLMSAELNAGTVALASVLVVASWVLLLLSVLACGFALYTGRARKAA
ncbi:hypothetical protein [Arthrobacter sp. 35W]|uniref:hypothetical protein n=1 Tax=Arthrobacter sp. 35W TaxID=1132441 RepID=UPI0004001186|nr:hypothetical protein [Arthrobacter sp. 35W]